MSTISGKIEWWGLMFLTIFLAFFLAFVLGGLTLGYIAKEMIRSNVKDVQQELEKDPPPKLNFPKLSKK